MRHSRTRSQTKTRVAALAPSPDAPVSLELPPHHRNLAIPRRGHVLTTVSEKYARPLRAAVALLTAALDDDSSSKAYRQCLSRRSREPGAWVARPPAEMLAWTLVAAWLTAFATRMLSRNTTLENASDWFFDAAPHHNPVSLVPTQTLRKANKALAGCQDPVGYHQLMPYVLDPHGPGSRISVRRDPSTKTARYRKRVEGIFYTPADVATYMARNCLESYQATSGPPMILDPACGTGVFLRAALVALKAMIPDQSMRELSETLLYGTDIDPWVLNATAFVLLADSLVDSRNCDFSPLLCWHRLRLNLACVDALRLDPPDRDDRSNPHFANHPVDMLESGRLPELAQTADFPARVPLSTLFTTFAGSGLVVMGNPPYSSLGNRTDLPDLMRLFTTLGRVARTASEVYPVFVEQMIRLAPPGAAAGTLVLPLSLACNVRPQFVQTRLLIKTTPGTWRFAFFDREPHALFGEDVKTRNCILFWSRIEGEHETQLESGPLRKWRGNHRAALLDTITFTPVDNEIRSRIPKIDGTSQARAYDVLSKRWDRFDHACASLHRMPLAQVLNNLRHTVFAGATAYNFLNVFLQPPKGVLENAPVLSQHPLHAIHFPSEKDAAAAFAMLSSHLAFWWWRVTGDGFHVTARFLADLPFGTDVLSGSSRAALASCGKRLWTRIRNDPVVSCNRGRSSLAYSPNGFDVIRSEIDHIMAEHACLDAATIADIQHATKNTARAQLRVVRST